MKVAPEKVEVCDTVGASDAHCGGTMMGLSCSLSLADATAPGHLVMTIVVSRSGAVPPFPEELILEEQNLN